MMRITVLDCQGSKFGRYHLVYGLASWPGGTRQNRGWNNARVVYERPAHPYEEAEQDDSPRLMCYVYRDWETLSADEAKYRFDADALRDGYHDALRATLNAHG